MLFPTYYAPNKNSLPTPSHVSIHRSWDGSLYAETNVLEACGALTSIENKGPMGVALVNGYLVMSSPANLPTQKEYLG